MHMFIRREDRAGTTGLAQRSVHSSEIQWLTDYTMTRSERLTKQNVLHDLRRVGWFVAAPVGPVILFVNNGDFGFGHLSGHINLAT